MAKEEQLADTGGSTGEKDVKKAKPTPAGTKPAQAEGELTLFDRLGGERGLTAIVEDFTQRLLQDPRVNWERKGVTRGGFSFHRNRPVTWNPTAQNVAALKKHMVEFLALATGGPAHYTGKEIQAAHAEMHLTNPEFDAAIGDIKASLDTLRIPDKEQQELLAIIESTRPQIVTER
ncbi:MAG TPA: group 1 truncated hemoglobin [Bacillota bacterium]|nr:group 1 truncated hemoglobin [Bacillota bacterium]